MERKEFLMTFETSEEEGSFKGYGSVFGNIDCYGDIVEKGAFVDTLNEFSTDGKKIPILWQHDPSSPIGYCSACEDEKGLSIDGKLLLDDVPKAKEARALIKANVISGLSIGYTVNDGGCVFDAEGNRHLKSVKLYEISLVTFPANEKATVTDVKEYEPTIRDAEHALIDVGFSRKRAKQILSQGFKQNERDVHEVQCDAVKEAKNSINELLNFLKGE